MSLFSNKMFNLIVLFGVSISTIQPVLLPAATATISESRDARIHEIKSLSEISVSQPEQTIYFFDIDDTLFDFPYMLGSKSWRKHITKATKNDHTQNWHDYFSLYLSRKHPVMTVEETTSQFIRDLQDKGYGVFGLTSRERTRWYDTSVEGIDAMTVSQLASVDINLNNENAQLAYADLIADSEYYEGVFFADLEPKGTYLLELFKNASSLPQKVIFVDDKLSQVESVAAALDQLGIDYECYWYTTTDEKAARFDPYIANVQLYHFWISAGENFLTDEEAASIIEQFPERSADDYLQWVLEEASAPVIMY